MLAERHNMRSFLASFPKIKVVRVLGFGALFLLAGGILRSYAAGDEAGNAQDRAPSSQAPSPQAPGPPFDISIFRDPIPSGQLAFLNHFEGMPSDQAIRDKQYRKLLQRLVPNCVFHYGHDMSLSEALDTVLQGSPAPVQVRDGRFMIVSGRSGPYLLGRGFIWIDMQDGIALGGFYFRPTNGEPTPTVNIFSQQVKEAALEMNQLPPDFAQDLSQWSAELRVPPVTTRYFITGSNKKIVLQHDEDYCRPTDRTIAPPEDVCEQMNEDAADIDVTAADFVDQTHHATNATAWMINDPDQIAWIHVRDATCSVGPNPLQCHILMTRERTRVIINRHPLPPPPHR
jgi:hypothetical protein